MDEEMIDEVSQDEMRADFYSAIESEDWNTARALLSELEDQKANTWKLRLDMNQAMRDTEPEEDYSNGNEIEYGL